MEIIAIDDDPMLLHTIKMVLEEPFGEIQTLEHPDRAMPILHQTDVKVIILDLNFAIGDDDGAEGLAWIKKIKQEKPAISIVVLTAHGFLEVAVESLKQGATDFLEKPFSNEKLIATIQAALNLANSKEELADAISTRDTLIHQNNQYHNMVFGQSESMQRIMEMVSKIAGTDASILITGEHGTGKEVLARHIHNQSLRASQPFIHADLSAISENLFASTLFGHVKGAFTDASDDKAGLMEAANLGTLFLDEIGDLPIHLQSKLLAVLENRTIQRVGDHRARAVDIRTISTSHKSLALLQESDQFRQDLLFRINTVHIELPPLRERKMDIIPLIHYFLDLFNRKYGKSIQFEKNELKSLSAYSWPGNIRELRNSVERMVIMGSTEDIRHLNDQDEKDGNLYVMEKKKIEEAIKRHAGNISHVAAELGIGRNTLYRKIKKYGL